MQEDRVFELKLPLGDAGTANLRFKARLPESEAVVVRYDLSSGGFGLSVEPQGGRAVCTKDGAGGEKVGDVLRYCTNWKIGYGMDAATGGVLNTVASFGGVMKWKIGLFDVAKAQNWDEVVEALTSNTPERTNEASLGPLPPVYRTQAGGHCALPDAALPLCLARRRSSLSSSGLSDNFNARGPFVCQTAWAAAPM